MENLWDHQEAEAWNFQEVFNDRSTKYNICVLKKKNTKN